MMTSKMREYTWNDILQLIWEDCGLECEEDQRQYGKMYYIGKISADPPPLTDTCIMTNIYDLPFDERFDKHINDQNDQNDHLL